MCLKLRKYDLLMHKFFTIYNFSFLITGILLLVYGSYTYLLEDNKDYINAKININQNNKLFNLNKNFIDSHTINKMYSEKNIEFVGPLDSENNFNIIVNIKNKPINPSIINQGNEIQINLKIIKQKY